MTPRSLPLLVLAALLPLAGAGCSKEAAAARKASKEYDKAEPEIRLALVKFFLPLTASKDAPFGDPQLLDVQLSFDKDRVQGEGKVPFRVTVLAGGKVSKAVSPERYKSVLRYEDLPGVAHLDGAKKVVRIDLGDDTSTLQGQLDVPTGKFTGRQKFGPGGR